MKKKKKKKINVDLSSYIKEIMKEAGMEIEFHEIIKSKKEKNGKH